MCEGRPREGVKYVGTELDVFAHARNWKAYWSSMLRPYVHSDVLEVGAGLGANVPLFLSPSVKSLLCLEPDPVLAARIEQVVGSTPGIKVRTGTVTSLAGMQFDAVLYIDVLEHIEDDKSELDAASALLKPGGFLIVLAPAHPHLFTPFDEAIGHFRRYTRASLLACVPAAFHVETVRYLDSVGLLASSANLLLRQSQPTLAQIRFWDTCIVPVSKVLDPLFGYRLGKSILGVWSNR